MAYSKSITDRFWAKVNKAGPVPEHMSHLGKCWVWTQWLDRDGYGNFWLERKNWGAHRVAWVIHFGAIPDGKHVLHYCDNPSCVNSRHLWLGSNLDNIRDKQAKGRNRGWKCATSKPESVPRGSAHWAAKLTEELVRDIRQRAADGDSRKQIARALGLKEALVGAVVARRSWKHVA